MKILKLELHKSTFGKSFSVKIVIERTLKLISITIHTARPGMNIGKGGQEVDKLKEEIRN